MRRLLIPLMFAAGLCAEAPKPTVVQTTASACASLMNYGIPCRQLIVVVFNSTETGGKFLVGLRYLDKDGEEVIESRYPVSGTSAIFYIDDALVLSATVGSLKTNEVGVYYGHDLRDGKITRNGK